MAEKECIEREAAYDAIKLEESGDSFDFNEGLIAAMNAIDSIPAADVRPVVRGKWGHRWFCSNMSGYEYACSCSVCGEPTYRMSLLEKMPNFCPNCGADMRTEPPKEEAT